MTQIKNKPKICKGTHADTKGNGCDTISYKRTFGLCDKCLRIWATETDVGMIWLKKQSAYKMKRNEKEEKKKHNEEKKMLNVSGAMRLSDTYFSRFIRLKHSLNGDCTCYTCGKIINIKEADNGHYIKREHKATRYHENNCRPQCKTCNGDIKHNGKQAEFRVNLSYEIGENEVIEIEDLARTTIKANYNFYKDISDYYREKVNELQKELKVKFW